MTQGTLYLNSLLDNRIFDLNDPVANRDDCLAPYAELRKLFLQRGVDLSTQDINPVSTSDFVIYHDMPNFELSEDLRGRQFLLIMEPPTVKKRSWEPQNHRLFTRIFTYDDSLAGTPPYVKINYTYRFPVRPQQRTEPRPGFCTTIIGRKKSKHKFELYSERLKVIRWFERNAPEDFQFYGIGWEGFRIPVTGMAGTLLGRKTNLSTYQGTVVSKQETLSRFRFAIAFENCGGISGYISEKIFDCLFAGAIPIYLGAPNVAEHIPPDAFIDYREFDSCADMYRFLKGMTPAQYDGYREAIRDFLASPATAPFRMETFASTIVDTVFSNVGS